jgi:uncharacterized spore protein YtfJ
MSAKEMLQNLGESLGATATVKSVFGEPIRLEGKTVVPVAKVRFGFGAGFGANPRKSDKEVPTKAEGGGGGGGVQASPAGALEITPEGTRFVTFPDLRLIAGAFTAGLAIGALLFRRKS